MIEVKKDIKVEDFIELLKPFSNQKILFSKTLFNGVDEINCSCDINLISSTDEVQLKINIKSDTQKDIDVLHRCDTCKEEFEKSSIRQLCVNCSNDDEESFQDDDLLPCGCCSCCGCSCHED